MTSARFAPITAVLLSTDGAHRERHQIGSRSGREHCASDAAQRLGVHVAHGQAPQIAESRDELRKTGDIWIIERHN